MDIARRIAILHPIPLIPMLQREAVIPIVRDLDAVDHGPVDRQHVLRLLLIPIAERRPAVRVPDIRKRVVPGVVVQVRQEGVGVVVDYLIGAGERLERGFECGVGARDGGAERGPFGCRVHGEEVGEEGREVGRVEVRDEDVGGAGGEEGGDEVRDLGGDVGREVGVERRVVDGDVPAPDPLVRDRDVVVADPEEVQRVLVDAAADIVGDLDLGARRAPAGRAELALVEPGPVGEAGAEVGLRHRVVDGGAEVGAAPGVAEGEVLVHGHAEEVGEVGYGDGAVGPGAEAVYCVSGCNVCWRPGCDIVRDAAVAVVG